MSDLRLEPLESADFPTLIRWSTSPEFLLQWAGPGFGYPLTVEELAEHHRGCSADPPIREMWKAIGITGEMIGHAELSSIDRRAATATISRVIVGDPRGRGKGVGTAIMTLLVGRAFDVLGLAALDLYVFDFNKRAIDCYTRVGFRIEGRMENVRRVGDSYWSMFRMSLERAPAQETHLPS